MNFNDQVKIFTMTKNLITKRDVSTLRQFFDYKVLYLLLYLPVNMQEEDRVGDAANLLI